MNSIQDQVLASIRRRGRGKVHTAKDFLDLGSRDAVDQALSRLARASDLQRLGRGLYHYPRRNRRLGIQIPPDPDEVAAAIARQTGTRIAPSGAMAANRLGLTTQVPARPVYLTDGRSRQVHIGDLVYTFKHTAPKDLPAASPASAMVFQALRHVGREAVDDEVISRLRRRLSTRQRKDLRRDARYATDWIAEVVRELAREEEEVVIHG